MTESNNPVAWTEVSNFTANTGTAHEGTWPEFVARLANTTRVIGRDVDEFEFELMDAAERKRRKFAVPCIIPGATVDGRLTAESFEAYTMVSLDIDNGAPDDLPDRLKSLSTAYVVYETVSSTAEDRRYRVWVPLAEPVPAGRYAAVARAVAGQLGVLDIVDPSGFSAAHKMSVPARWEFDEHDRVKKAATKRAPLDWRSLDLAGPAKEPAKAVPAGSELDPYVAAAVADELEILSSAQEGGRNHQLNKSAYSLGQFVGAGLLDKDEAVERLTEAAHACGMTEADDLSTTLGSGLSSGMKNPRQLDKDPAEVFDTYEGDDGEDVDDVDEVTGVSASELRREVARLRTRKLAQQIVAQDDKLELEPFDAGTLAELLARDPEPAARVAGLMPWGGSTLVVGARKSSKSTLMVNLARCLITGEKLLGRLEVRPIAPDATVAILNYEVSSAQLAGWASDVGVPPERLLVVNLRGRRNPLTDPEDRARLAALLRSHNVETLIVDPFGRAFGGESQNDAGQVQAWLVQLDRFARVEVGATDVILTAHAGWNGERTRGSSALEDWADSIIKLTRDEQDGDHGPRYISALGRDVELKEDRMNYDDATRWLSLSGAGSRKKARDGATEGNLAGAILAALDDAKDGLNSTELVEATGNKTGALTRVRNELVAKGLIVSNKRQGRGGGTVYSLPEEDEGELP